MLCSAALEIGEAFRASRVQKRKMESKEVLPVKSAAKDIKERKGETEFYFFPQCLLSEGV